jgi:hypothetical protein
MKHYASRQIRILLAVLLLVILPIPLAAEPSGAAISSFRAYVVSVEARLAQQHRFPVAFLAPTQPDRPDPSQPIIEKLTPNPSPVTAGAMLHHWRGTAFVAGAKAADFDRLLHDLPAYPRYFAPQVLTAALLSGQGDHLRAAMRVRQHHVLTVVLDTDYEIDFGSLDDRHRYSTSRSTKVSEIASPGTSKEHALNADEEHGFLYCLNTYWSYDERPEGLYLQIESISLTRSIPSGLGWAIGPFVESIPRESLEFTLQSAAKALRH